MKNYYRILGLSPQCSEEEIRSAYRKLALLNHPDVSDANDAEAFMLVQEAYSILSNPSSRAAYDRSHAPSDDEFLLVEVDENGDEWIIVDDAEYQKAADVEDIESSGPVTSGFGRATGGTAPFMFLLWIIIPVIGGGLGMELGGEPVWALTGVLLSVLVMFFVHFEVRKQS